MKERGFLLALFAMTPKRKSRRAQGDESEEEAGEAAAAEEEKLKAQRAGPLVVCLPQATAAARAGFKDWQDSEIKVYEVPQDWERKLAEACEAVRRAEAFDGDDEGGEAPVWDRRRYHEVAHPANLLGYALFMHGSVVLREQSGVAANRWSKGGACPAPCWSYKALGRFISRSSPSCAPADLSSYYAIRSSELARVATRFKIAEYPLVPSGSQHEAALIYQHDVVGAHGLETLAPPTYQVGPGTAQQVDGFGAPFVALLPTPSCCPRCPAARAHRYPHRPARVALPVCALCRCKRCTTPAASSSPPMCRRPRWRSW